MAAKNHTADVRTESQKTEMAEGFAEYEYEYRNTEDAFTVVYEDDECVVIADHTGHELNEWASDFGVEREDLRQTMRALAEQEMSRQDAHEAFSYSDPVVFDKLAGDN